MMVLSNDSTRTWSRVLSFHQQVQRSVSKPTRLIDCLRLDANCGANPLYECIIKLECAISSQMPIRMLSLRRPGSLVYSCVDLVEAIQNPEQLFKVKWPESHMVLRLLFICLLLFLPRVRHLAVVKRSIVSSINAKIKVIRPQRRISGAEQDKHSGKEFISNR